MGYIIYGDGEARGPVAKALGAEKAEEIRIATGVSDGDAVFLPVPMKQLRHRLPAVRGYGLARSRA